MTNRLPRDAVGQPIPAVRIRDGAGAHTIAATALSARNTTPFEVNPNNPNRAMIASLYATVPVYIRFGTSSVVATTADHYFPEGIYYDFSVNPDFTHVAVLRAGSSDGSVYVSEKE